MIAAEGERLERLVGDVLDLAKLDAHRFTVLREEVDMQRLVDRAYSSFGEEARRRAIDYRQEVLAKPVIITDGDRVLQVITNLLSNAFRWTPDGGTIELELAAENGTISVAVEDSGPGISGRERERIFRPFWSRDGGGTGLGLAIARELANRARRDDPARQRTRAGQPVRAGAARGARAARVAPSSPGVRPGCTRPRRRPSSAGPARAARGVRRRSSSRR